jgi:phage gp29-like protein
MRGVGLETLGGRGAWLCAKGRGVMLAGCLARMFKQIPLQDWLTYCDRHGMPAFIGQTNAQKGTQGWQDMADAVAAIGSEYGAVINQGDLIKTLDLATTGQLPYEKLIERMDRAQIMLWMGGDLSTMSRENGTGSNPQQEDADELHGDNAEWVSEIINRGLTTQVLDYYFRGSPHLVELRLRTKIRQNQTQELAAVDHARKQGIRISKSWYISKFAVVEADDDEPALGETAVPVPPTPAAPAADLNALNSAEGDTATMLKTALADAIGVRSQVLDGLDDLIADLAKKSSEDITDEEFLQFVEQAAQSLPELFSSDAAHELFLNLEAALGTASVNGIRQSLSTK